ncbi:MAG: hypothetical protein ACLTDR_13440 [Adlercreutzia equolifaciens]
MFNRVLCEERWCRKVLRAALGIEAGEIASLNAEQCFEPLAAGRGVRLDVFARGDGRVYDIRDAGRQGARPGAPHALLPGRHGRGGVGVGRGLRRAARELRAVLLPPRRLRQGRARVRDRAQVWGHPDLAVGDASRG